MAHADPVKTLVMRRSEDNFLFPAASAPPPFWSAECSELIDVGVVPDLDILRCLGSPQGRYCQAWLGRLVRPAVPVVGASWSGGRPVWAMIG
jgi:hypothetical protein